MKACQLFVFVGLFMAERVLGGATSVRVSQLPPSQVAHERSVAYKSTNHTDISNSNDLPLFKASKEDEPLQKCYDVLSEVSEGDSGLSKEKYLVFLAQISNGDVYFDEWKDLSALFLLIFLTSACTTGQDCVNEPPKISFEDELSLLEFFCSQILRHVHTRVELTFEYTARYDQDISEDSMRGCLEGATEALLIQKLAHCDPAAERPRLLTRTAPGKMSFRQESGVELAEIRRIAFKEAKRKGLVLPKRPAHLRTLQQNDDKAAEDSVDHDCGEEDAEEKCEYDVSVSISRMTDFRK